MFSILEDACELFTQSFSQQAPRGLVEHLYALNSAEHEQDLSQLALSIELFKASISHKGDQHLALAALCLPYALQHKVQAFQNLLPIESYQLLKQCLVLQSLEKLIKDKNSHSTKHNDQLRKMLLSMAGDTRVIVLILLYQLYLLKNLKKAPIEIKEAAARTIQNIYAPLANRLGMGQIKWQLEDIAFHYLNPTAYQEIKAALNMRRQDREQYVLDMKNAIQTMVDTHHISHYQCDGRAKHIYSIYNKCTKKDVQYDELYDTIAIRILTDTIDDCYLLLSAIHETFTPITSEFDDYIANPKPNGYQSIHTVILGPDNQRVEIQLRTFTMHHQAEHGAYAHWMYKEGQQSEAKHYEQKLAQLRQLLEWQKQVHQGDDKKTTIEDLFIDRIYVFSPQGRIIDLPRGATALDFAYSIHTDIGHKTKGAQVNGKLQPLNQPLKNADEILIQTKNEPGPSRDWLNPQLHFLKTKHAKQKVAHWFRLLNQKENLQKGQQTWEKLWRSKKLPKNILEDVYPHFNFKDSEGLLTALGSGDISIAALTQYIKSILDQDDEDAKDINVDINTTYTLPKIKQNFKTNVRAPVSIDGQSGLISQLAKCCHPIPGDEIVAYSSATRGVIIHQAVCPNLIAAKSQHPEKFLPAEWNNNTKQAFNASLKISFQDRDHFLHDITGFCAQHKLPIKHMATSTKKKGHGPFELLITVIVQSPDDLDKLIHGIKQIRNVFMVTRVGNIK